MQIDDRFHLHKSLLKAIKDAINQEIPSKIKIVNTPLEEPNVAVELSTDIIKQNATIVTAKNKLSDAEKQLYEEIVKIQNYLLPGYSPTQICNLMHTTYKRIRKYAAGYPEKLCKYTGNSTLKFDQISIKMLL